MAKVKFALGLILLVSLSDLILPTGTVIASPDEVKWSRVNTPTEGKASNWVLAKGSDAQHPTMATDGTLYCYANPSGTSYTLYKSTDGGYNWSYTGKVDDTIVDIATAPVDTATIYYATPSNIYQSTDAGSSFNALADTPPPLDGNESITCLNVGYDDNNDPYVFIGTADGNYGGGVYYIPEADSEASWTDLNIGEYDVYSIAGSPQFATDHQLVAVATDGNKTWVKNNYEVTDTWTTGVELKKDDSSSFIITAASDICFPSDFDLEYGLFVGVVGNGGDIYRVTATEAYDLGVDKDIISLDLAGDTQLLAGENGATEVWRSPDGGINWTKSSKQPTGGTKTYVLMAPDFSSSGRAYAATSGTGSAFSYTADGGVTYNQIGLIDTKISDIIGMAPSSSFSQGYPLFMLTRGGEHSLWRSLNGSARWERVFTSTLANAYSFDRIALSPNYHSSQVIFIAGSSNGNPAIWKSTDNGQNFAQPKLTPFPVDIWVWAVANDNTLFIGGFDIINHLGLVYVTIDSGSSYSTPAVVGSYQLHSIALSSNYEEDETILVGNTGGWVYWSNDNGTSFEPLGQQLPQLLAEEGAFNDITVAFDPDYSHNNTVYAASHCYKAEKHSSAIYRFIIGTSITWESIDSTLPDDSEINQLIVSPNGTLYAINSQPVDVANKEGGMERCLNPSYPLGPTFETVPDGLNDGVILSGLWLYGNQLWSTDTTNTRLMTFTDTLAAPVNLTSPPNQAPGVGTIIGSTIRHVSLTWEPLSGATSYTWQLDYSDDFSATSIPFEGDTGANSARLTALEPATTYYWRVRATEPLLSPWAASWSFTTTLGSTATAPSLRSPGAGAKSVELKPVFQWSAIAGADSYELLVATNISFTNPAIAKISTDALPTTAWQSDITLDYDTTYYWKIRARDSDSYSAWSAVGAFTIEPPPTSESPSPASELSPPPSESPSPASELSPPPSESPSPASESPPPVSELSPPASESPSPAQQTIPGWATWLIYLGSALLATMIAGLITVIILVVKILRF